MFIRSIVTAVSLVAGLSGAVSGQLTARNTASTTPTFFITGHGWGHGVGMSQYGAYGYALHGWKYERIVTHYFVGTTIGDAPTSNVRVLLAAAAKRVTISSKLPFLVTDGNGDKHKMDPGKYTFGPAFKVKVADTKKAKPLPGPLVFSPGATALAFNGRGYRGSLQVTRQGAAMQVVNNVPLDLYVRGVVPWEMPKTWTGEALKAQAVVARSYALAHLHRGGGFDLYPDTRSQMYGGIRAEAPTSNDAVNETAGKVVLYKGKVANTMFFSTSGGRTASNQDVFTASAPVPYLVSVPDPYDSISPYHTWGPIRLGAARLARALHAPGRLLDVETSAAPSGRVRTVTATATHGEATASGADLRNAFGLRSTWFRIGMLALSAPQEPVVYGSKTRLGGTVRGVASVDLQVEGEAGWKTVATLTPTDGAVSRAVRPTKTVAYRLLAGTIASGSVRVAVAPFIRLHVPPDHSGFWGVERPTFTGQTVQIQREQSSGWRTIARTTVTAAGKFTIARAVSPGTYRARLSPGHGLVSGISPDVRVG
jgi:stage II sporulation protein D